MRFFTISKKAATLFLSSRLSVKQIEEGLVVQCCNLHHSRIFSCNSLYLSIFHTLQPLSQLLPFHYMLLLGTAQLNSLLVPSTSFSTSDSTPSV